MGASINTKKILGVLKGAFITAPSVFSNLYSTIFDGVDEHLTSDTDAAPAFGEGGDFTINLWVYRTSTSGSQKLISKTVGSASEFQIFVTGSGSLQWNSTLWNDGASLASTNNVWEMWTYSVRQSSNTATWFKNGASPNVKDITGLTGTFGDGTLYFGRYNTAYNFAGNIDEISFWDTSLNGSEILALYNDGVPTDLKASARAANLTNWWRMGDPSGTASFPTIVDKIGGVNMTMTNMTAGNIRTDVPS